MSSIGLTGECTDVRNAERLVAWFGGEFRWIATWQRFAAWDQTRWALDGADAIVTRHAISTGRRMLAEAQAQRSDAERAFADASAAGDVPPRVSAALAAAKAAVAWALKSQDVRRVGAMISLAKSAEQIAISHEQLDAKPWALNVANGTIDLTTGTLWPHAREDLLTKIAPVAYDPKALAPTWLAFLDRAMAGNAELIDFLARLIGYSLTGEIREHVLAFFYGGGANGKSTMVGTTHAMLGDYASAAPRGLLFTAKNEQHPTELASLYGARFVTCAEIEDGRTFDEAKIKDLTGGDVVEVRRMREDFWKLRPTHKLFLSGNHKPVVRGTDDGIWRRICLVPWTVTIPVAERDAELPTKLRAELPGVLAWAVRGCLEWQRGGLKVPAVVHDATDAYREESDPVGEFFALRCVFEPDARVTRKMLRAQYESFAEENGVRHTLDAKKFAEAVRRRGATDGNVRHEGKSCDGWHGVKLATDAEREAASTWRASKAAAE